jgi:hypothetical protein
MMPYGQLKRGLHNLVGEKQYLQRIIDRERQRLEAELYWKNNTRETSFIGD